MHLFVCVSLYESTSARYRIISFHFLCLSFELRSNYANVAPQHCLILVPDWSEGVFSDSRAGCNANFYSILILKVIHFYSDNSNRSFQLQVLVVTLCVLVSPFLFNFL